MDPTSFRLPGAVTLQPAAAPAAAAAGHSSGGAHVIDVTTATFQALVVERSRTVPVVLDFWASWCGPCRQLSPVLEKLAAEGGGSWVLAKVDCDANPQLAQAAQVQGIPAVKAVVGGQIVGEFTGAMPEREVREWIASLLQLAAEQGVGGSATGSATPDDAPALSAGDEALAAGDLAAAEAAYRAALTERPGDDNAATGLARVALLDRSQRLDPAQLQQQLADQPASPAALTGMADVLVLADRAEDAFAMLVEAVRASSGTERDALRVHLLELFTALGPEHPAVGPARRALTNALF